MKKRFRFLIGSTVFAIVIFVACLVTFAFTGQTYQDVGTDTDNSADVTEMSSDENQSIEIPEGANVYTIDLDEARKQAVSADAASVWGNSSTISEGFSYNASNSYYYRANCGTSRAQDSASKSKWWSSVSCSVDRTADFYITFRGDINTARSYGNICVSLRWNWYHSASNDGGDYVYSWYQVWGAVNTQTGYLHNGWGSASGTYYGAYQRLNGDCIGVRVRTWAGASRGSKSWRTSSCSCSSDVQVTSCWVDIYFEETPVSYGSNGGGSVSCSDTSLRFYEQSNLIATAYDGYYFKNWSNASSSTSRDIWTSYGFQYNGNPYFYANFAAISITNKNATFTYNGGRQGPTASAGSRSITNYYNTRGDSDSGCGTSAYINVGTYYHRCIVQGDSGYGYTWWQPYYIKAKSITGGNTTVGAVSNVTYTGKAFTPVPTLYDNARKVYLTNGTDYYCTYANNTNAGTATVYVNGKGNYTGTVSVTFTISKCSPTLSGISATAITYGQTLANSKLSGIAKRGSDGTVLSGTWSWNSTSTAPAVANSNSTAYALTFKPTDTNNYSSVGSSCKLTVYKATPSLSGVSASRITYGQTLSSSSVSGTAKNPYNSSAVYGTWAFTSTSTIPTVTSDSGKTKYEVKFTPNSSYANNYNTNTSSCTLVVNKAIPVISDTSAETIVFEQKLTDSAVSGTVKNCHCATFSVPGKFYWYTSDAATVGSYSDTTGRTNSVLTKITDSAFINMPEVSQSGTYNIVFVPDDTASYVSTCATAKLTVTPKAQTLSINALDKDNADVAPESIATKSSGYTYWADYEIEMGKAITLTAYTTAIYPTQVGGIDKPRKIIISVNDSDLATLGTPVYSYETISGVTYSKVTVTLTAADTSGIVIISANQYDNVLKSGTTGYSVDNRGDYQNATTFSYRLYVKKAQYSTGTFNGEAYAKNYGDSSFEIAPQLNSNFKNYTITSTNSDIIAVTVSQNNDANRTATVKNVGSVTFTLSHPGYVDPSDSTNAWLSFKETATATVASVTLQISIESIDMTYGDTPNFRYLYYGFKYDDAATIPVSVSNDYNFETMHDVLREGGNPDGAILSYTINPVSAKNTGKYNNYTFEYLPSTMTINPKALVATINDDTKAYGDVTPDFPVTFTGFVMDETVSTANVTKYPTVNYGESKSNQFQTIGEYTIAINADGSSANYYFETDDTSTLFIVPADVVITYDPWNEDFTGKTHFKDAIFDGVAGGLKPINIDDASAIAYRYSLDGNNWVSDLPITADSYDVEITFTCVDGDNYKTTTITVPSGLTVNQIDPTIYIEPTITDYTAYNITLPATVSGVDEVYLPVGSIQYFYSNSATPSEFKVVEPKDVETYNIKVVYTQGENDNYHDFEIVFDDVLIIEKVDATIALAQKVATYSVSGGTPTKVKAFGATVSGFGTDVLPTDDGARFAYEYYIDGVFTTDLPYNAGTYPVKVTYAADANGNYNTTETIFSSGVLIEKASLFDSINLEYLECTYSGDLIAPAVATYYGLENEGGSAPIGSIAYAFRISGSAGSYISARGRTESGIYSIRVSYITTAGDNYESCNKEFEGIFNILKANPTITFKAISAFNYNGSSFSVEATVTGTPVGSAPLGELSYEYLIGDSWVSDYSPSEAGTYSVRATYTSVTGDNYADSSYVENDYLKIKAVAPSLSINFVSVDYTGEPLTFETPLGNVRGALYDNAGPQGTLTYEFRYAGEDTWTTDVPYESGAYDVKVTYKVGLTEVNYIGTDRIFLNAVIINNIAPTLSLRNKTVTYNGAQVSAYTPQINTSHGEAKGVLTTEYRVNNQWTTIMPTNAGVYNVRVLYRAATVDNYKSYSQIFEKALTINPLEITVTPKSGQFKIYDGNAPEAESITFEADDLIKGNVWTGSLEAGTNCTVGQYDITLGTLSAGNNYTVNFEEGVMYSIRRKEVKLIFGTINPIYDGSYKNATITVDPDSLVGYDAVSVFTDYEGDNRNVGKFKAVAVMAERNYVLPADNTQEYEITPARMAGNSFVGYQTEYDGMAHELTITTMMEGATVSYDSPTQYYERGSYTVIATVSKKNYFDEELTATLVIVKGHYDVTVFQLAETYYYGNALPSLKTDCDNYGVATLDAEQTLLPGVTEYTWTFVPNDPENYEISTGTTQITVEKAVAEFTVKGPLSQSLDNPENIEAFAVNGNESYATQITYTDSDGKVFYSRPTVAGRYTMTATFSGNDLYEASEYSTIVTIEETVDLWWVWLIVGIVALLAAISVVVFIFKKKKSFRA